MKKHPVLLGLVWTCCLALGPAIAQQGRSIVTTKHNLSVTGPGPYRSESETRVCIFCHTSHRAHAAKPLWNREDSRQAYLTYESPTFEGAIGQPNGTTKLCLSCHDGTVALGRVLSLNAEIPMSPGRRYLTARSGLIGTNLRDDHPVSFHYEASRARADREYRPSSGLTGKVHLDAEGDVQCTSCHDPHANTHGFFLNETDRRSELCLDCHSPQEWEQSAHAASPATWNGRGLSPWPDARYDNVRDNGCSNCHQQHGAGRPQHLLKFALLEENCVRCHNGNVAAANIERDIRKASAHTSIGVTLEGAPSAAGGHVSRTASCSACHNPHKTRGPEADRPDLPGSLYGAVGVSSSGTELAEARSGSQICYKCHGDSHGAATAVPRVIEQANTRLEFDPGNPSFHPVEAPGRNLDVPSLLAPWTTASRVTCWDCHSSESSKAFGGIGPRGPHGSNYRPLLGARFNTYDGTPESPAQYALCYKCHNRSSILSDVSFRYHSLHVESQRAPCSVCHDSHGISSTQGSDINNSHLINFDASVVAPSQQMPGTLEFVDLGSRRGTCTLLCHGKDHVDSRY